MGRMTKELHELREEHSKIIEDVICERARQNQKFGANRHHHPAEWLMILGEEVGEVNEERINFTFSLFEGKKIRALQDMRNELIQVAAVAMAFIQDIDDNYTPEINKTIKNGRFRK